MSPPLLRRTASRLNGLLLTALPLLAVADPDIEQVEVLSSREREPTSVSKGGLPPLETPQNIQVIPAGLLHERGDKTLEDALRNVAGVMPGGYYQSWDYFRIRGFDASGYIFQDSLAFDSGVQLNAELYGLDRIEILKGPSSALYGQGSLGGLVNLVSKHPEPEPFATLSASYGSFGTYEADFDGNTAMSPSAAVAGRIVAVQRHSGAFTAFVRGNDRTYLAPSLSWRLDAATTLALLASYQHDHIDIGFPLTYVGGVAPGALGRYSLDTYTGEPGRSNRARGDRDALGLEFRHDFNRVLSFSANARYAYNENAWDHILYSSYLDADDRTLVRYPYSARGHWTDFGIDSKLTATFTTGSIEHSLVGGIDCFDYDYRWNTAEIDYSNPSAYMPLDLYHPVYGAPFPTYSSFAHVRQVVRDTGFYLQEHARIDHLTLTLSGRWDHATAGDSWSGSLVAHTDHHFVPRAGITYEVLPGAVVYGSYSESFLPISGSTAAGRSLKPETGEQWEVGAKARLPDSRLDVTLSLFQLTRQNVATADLTHAGFSVQTGEQRSRGVEVDAHAALTSRWQAILSYAYIDAKVTRDNSIPVGDRPQNAPPASLGLWTKYIVGPFGIGAGVYHYSAQAGDLPNTFDLPAYTLVNMSLAYTRGALEAQLTARNLGDVRYFTGSYNSAYVQPGSPRAYLLELTWHP